MYKKLILLILIIIIILGTIFTIYVVRSNLYKKAGMKNIFANVEEVQADLTEYIVYGTHLNMKGKIKDNFNNIVDMNLIFANIDGQKKKFKLNYEENGDKIYFYTSELINEGIDLEELDINKHFLLIEVKGENGKTNYYSIKNKTEYDEILYYTITKNNSNNKVKIEFSDYKNNEANIQYMLIDVKHTKLPKEVYDIVIDPGHGGSDTGAKYGGYDESDLNLEYAKMVKSELERLGLKVKITRDGTEDEENFGARNCL